MKQDIEISIPSDIDVTDIEKTINQAIEASDLNITMHSTLKKFPGCTHWHTKSGKKSGTLEITLWPKEHRAWFTVQSGRKGEWIDEKIESMQDYFRTKWGT